MDWLTVFSSIVSSSLVAGIAVYVVKRLFDQSLDKRLERFRNENKVYTEEKYRRQAIVFNEKYNALKEALSVIYRARNNLRDFIHLLETSSENGIAEKESARKLHDQIKKEWEILDRLMENTGALSEILYKERAILSEFMYNLVHDIKGILITSKGFALWILEDREKEIAWENLTKSYEKLESKYQELLELIREELEIS